MTTKSGAGNPSRAGFITRVRRVVETPPALWAALLGPLRFSPSPPLFAFRVALFTPGQPARPLLVNPLGGRWFIGVACVPARSVDVEEAEGGTAPAAAGVAALADRLRRLHRGRGGSEPDRMGKMAEALAWLAVVAALASLASALQTGKGMGKDNLTVTEAITEDTYAAFFPHKDDPLAHATGFYDYRSFLSAAALFQKEGFGLKGGSLVQRQELAAFLAHVAHSTTCGYSRSLDGPYAWGLCYKEELSPSSLYCEASDIRFPCMNGVSYHGRGAFPLTYNYHYGTVGNALKLPLLSNPNLVASNATIAYATAIWQWVTPQDPNPSAHSVMVHEWTPNKTDTAAFRTPGFGMTINVLAGQLECGHGDDARADDRIGHYTKFVSEILGLDLGKNLDCGTQGMLPTGFTAVL